METDKTPVNQTEGDVSLDGARSASQYDRMAREYRVHNQNSGANAYYERPATKALLGSVAGKRVMEVGCGSGPLTKWLVEEGADVTAFDVSPAMLALARESIGDSAKLLVADLNEPLNFVADESFDLIVASLVLHYVRDWSSVLSEFRRVIRSTGSVIFSTHHPAWDWQNHCPEDYFAFIQVSEVWIPPHEVTFWRRPLRAMMAAIADAGFVIERLIEAEPLPELLEHDASAYKEISASPFFLHMRLRPLQPDGSMVAVTAH